jgi:nucleotide-binding universal stress UspA family protein
VTVVRVAASADDRTPDVRTAVTVRAALTADTRQALEPFVDKYPDVPVDVLVVAGDPAAHLAASSRQARLLVVGAHAADRPTGPVGRYLMHHSFCPVLFARALGNTGRRHADHRQL